MAAIQARWRRVRRSLRCVAGPFSKGGPPFGRILLPATSCYPSRRRAADELGVEDPEEELRRWQEEQDTARPVPPADSAEASG